MTKPIRFTKRIVWHVLRSHYRRKYRRQCREKGFTLISSNCLGGVVYHRLGLPFLSPTINCSISHEDFCKLVENPEHYFGINALPQPRDKHPDLQYPVLLIDDIEVFCVHYESPNEAVDAWNRRRKRVNLNRVCILACEWDLGCNEKLIARIAALPYPKIIYTTNPSHKDNDDFIYLSDKKYRYDGSAPFPIPNLLTWTRGETRMMYEKDAPFYRLLMKKLKSYPENRRSKG